MKTITCIVCPNGCELETDGKAVSGNLCPKGAQFALQEMNDPQRVVTSTIRTSLPDQPVVACRTNREVPKDKMIDVIKAINSVMISEKLDQGSVVISNVADTGADVITTGIMK